MRSNQLVKVIKDPQPEACHSRHNPPLNVPTKTISPSAVRELYPTAAMSRTYPPSGLSGVIMSVQCSSPATKSLPPVVIFVSI